MKSKSNPFLKSAALAASIVLTLGQAASAADFYWDFNGATTTATGGAGNWSTASTWRDSSSTGTLGNWVDGNTAVLGGTAGAVTITSGVTITTPKISVTAANYSLSGGTVAFGGTASSPGIIDVNSVTGFTFASNATGSLKMMSTGGTTTLATATAMLINGSTNLTSFELALATDSNHIILNNAAGLGTASSAVKLTKGVLNLGNNAVPNNDVPISYNAWATDLAGGTIRARFNASTWNGATSLSANSMLMTRGSATVSMIFSSTGTINLNANTLSINAASASLGVDLQGTVSGAGNITLVNTGAGGTDNGQGITKLSAANTFSGTATTTQNLGTLALNHVNALQNATLNTGLSGTQAVTFVLAGTNTYNIGALQGSDALAIGANTISLGNKAGSSSFGADISGAGGLTKTGSNSTQILTTSTNYSGATSITGGTLSLTGSGAINSSSGISVNGSGAKLLHTGSTAISSAVTLTNGNLTGSGTVNTVNVGAGTGGIISNNDGVAGAALSIGTLTLSGGASINLYSNSTSAALNVTTALSTGATAATITANNAGGWTNGTTYNLIGYAGGPIGGSGNNFAHAVNNLSARQSATWGDTGSAIQLTVNGDNPYWTGAATGLWNTADTNWKLVTGGTNTEFLASDDVLFDDNATGTTTIDINAANVTPNSAVFNNTTSVAYNIGSTGGFGISSGSITKNNSGTVTISSANTYTGPTTINGGSVVLSGAGTLGTGSALMLGGGSLDLGTLNRTVGAVSITSAATSGDTISNGSLTGTSYAASNTTGNAIISANLLANGALGFTKTGAGTVTLAGANTYTGTTAINAGSLVLSGSGTLGNGAALTLGGGSLDLGTLSRTAGAISVNSAAASGDTISNGSLTGTSYAASNTSGNTIISANLLVNGAAGFTMSGVGGTTTLSGANTYTGATSVSGGTLKAGSANAFNDLGALSLSSTGAFNLAGFNAAFTNLTSASTNTITTTGTGSGTDVLTISALGSDAGASAVFTDNGTRKLQVVLNTSAGSVQATSNTNNTFSGGLILNGTMRAAVLGGTVGTPGAITSGQFGTGAITVNGSSQIQIAASNRTLVNDVIVNGNAGNGSRPGSFRIGTNGGAVTGLVISGNITANLAEAHFGADPTSGGSTLLLSGKLTGSSGFRFFSSNNNQAWTTTLNNATGNPNDYNGNTTINSSLTTLALGASNQIPNGIAKGNVILTSGFLDLAGFDETINGLSGAGTVDNVASGTANKLTLGDADATNQAFSGAIQNTFGTLSLTKIGSGTQTLSGTNTYDGTTTINGGTLLVSGSHSGAAGTILISAGTLQIGNNTATGVLSSTSTITNNGTLAFNRTGTVTQGTDFAAGIIGSGAFSTSGTGTVILSGTNSYEGATSISNGELRLASASAINNTSSITVSSGRLSLDGGITTGSGKSVTINGSGANFFGALQGNSGNNVWEGGVVVGGTAGTRVGVNAGSLKITNVISGSTALNGVALRPNSGTTLELAGANTYLGDTSIISGTGEVKLSGGANRLPTGTKLLFGSGITSGILNLNGQSQEVAGLSVVGGSNNEIKSTAAATLTVNTAVDSPSSYAGIITGATALTKTGAEALTLTNTNSYTGDTTITTGTLALTGAGSINNSALIDVQSSGTLSIAGVTTSTTIGSASAQTLKGLGSVDLGVKTMTIAGSGTLAPGASPGTLDFIASAGGKLDFAVGSTIAFELGTLSDLVSFDSAGDWLTGSDNATLSLSLLGGFDYGNTYTIFQNVTTTGFTMANITGYDTGAYSANFVQSGNDYNLSFTAIPEPNVAALLGGLGTLLLLRRRRD
jgi:autotransporter-associated beta strand protein